ncbi:hypothetical protein ACIRPX_41695 [Streptomyces sp. NPDC101225]|uniref:hypothetical protein n=1 Tax=Streptomyces sp. NPDC101225 TaxID=3366135 RepID=UPI0038216024
MTKNSRIRGAQAGDGNVQHNTYLPPQRGAHHSRDYAPSATVTTGDHSTVNQKNTHLRLSVPVIGPLLAMSSAHPVVAGVTALAVLGGGGLAANAALSDPRPSVSTALVRGFHLQDNGQGAPIGYDFSRTPPAKAGTSTDAVYVSGGYLVSSNGKLAEWSALQLPSAADCREAVAKHPIRQTVLTTRALTCYVDRDGNPGYILVTGSDSESTIVDTAHLR